MWIVGLLMLVALGVLGVASWLKSTRPEAAGPLAQLEGVSGWVGLVGLVWGVFGLIQWIGAMGAISVAPVMMLVALASALSIIALSLILAMPTVKTLAGSNGFTVALEQTAGKLGPFKMVLGFVCLGLAVWSLVMRVV